MNVPQLSILTLQMEIVVREEASLFEMSLVLPRQKQMILLCLCGFVPANHLDSEITCVPFLKALNICKSTA